MKTFHLLLLGMLLPASTLFGQDFVQIAVRGQAREHFADHFRTDEPPIAWTGDSVTGDAGTTSAEYRLAVFDQINYFREQAGLLEVSERLEYSEKAQHAALMMSVNRRQSHYPDNTWLFYTEEGSEAAARSNIYLSVSGIDAIEGYMDDPGTSNYRVGHRNWILRPQTLRMGTGDVPGNEGYSRTNVLWVVTPEWGTRATRSPYNCWPPENGYTPYQVAYRRWSFKSEGAGLSNAAVEMWDAEGNAVPLAIDHKPTDDWYPLVWIPEIESSRFNRPRRAPAEDEWYRVRITGIEGTGPDVVEYTVVVFDPAKEVSIQEAVDLRVLNEGGQIYVSWATPVPDIWTLQKSDDLEIWTDVDQEILHDGFRARAGIVGESDGSFYRLRR